MNKKNLHKNLTFFIALVWLINGLICKVLDVVPRHREIVARILGENHSQFLTILIGVSEIIMAIWILTRFKARLNAIVQMTIVALMNILESILAADLLLWGRLNAVFALLFIILIYINEFVLNRRQNL